MKKRVKKQSGFPRLTKKELTIAIIVIIVIITILYIYSQPDVVGELGLGGELATLNLGMEEQLEQGLVGYWKFNRNVRDNLKEHNGRPCGVEIADGIYGKAYKFDGSTDYRCLGSEDYIRIPFEEGDSLDFGNKPAITTSFWLNLEEIPEDNDGRSRVLYWEDYKTTDGNERIEWIARHVGRGTYRINWKVSNSDGSSGNLTQCINLSYGQWHMVTGTYDGQYKRVYLDGSLCSSREHPGVIHPTYSGDDWVVGDATRDKKRGIAGRVDELRIYNRSLFSSEIAALYSEPVEITRSVECISGGYRVTLNIDAPRLSRDEVMIISEKHPSGASMDAFSWNINPTYRIFESEQTLVWLFAKNPPVILGEEEITDSIPTEITYELFAGSGEGQFTGKVGLQLASADGDIKGDTVLPSC